MQRERRTAGASLAARRRHLLRGISARDPRSARVWAVVALMATVLTNVVSGAVEVRGVPVLEVAGALALAALSAVLLRVSVDRAGPLIVLAPLAGVATIVWLDLATHDAGVTGQVFFIVPVVWAAAQLRTGGVAIVTAATIAGEGVVVWTLLEPRQAATDFAYLTVVFLLVSGVLTRAAAAQERLVDRLREQASIDPLTGLWTRRVLDTATARAVQHRVAEASLVIIDLDRFKTINDTYGHLGGDAALTHVAELLTGHCREADVVARMGGDELAVLMLDCPREIAAHRAQQFVDAVRSTPLHLPGGALVPLSISAGLATLSPSATRAEDLYASADAALYVAKRAGRGRLSAA
ncbi:GGDEF domain-containing protein [Kineococcus sp. LSe6-4]|uniref:GGDEF domain-containing protein n=1 Tax=Kineococcus halophytocola TaxID=3234027 RepID=A0ABV4GWK0_9ACTN